jgi:predicted NAD/FAD-dependent oxidoreductase
MDSERVETIIIGAGITGSVLSHATNATILEKAKREGGRCSSGRITKNLKYDKGASMVKNEVLFQIQNQFGSFSLREFLKKIYPNFLFSPVINQEGMFLPGENMQSLVELFLKNEKKYLSSKITKVYKENHFWKVYAEDGTYFTSKNLVITAPIPQALEMILETSIYKEWQQFTQPYAEYKTCLVLAGHWENRGLEIHKDHKISELNPSEDMEYFTLETHKKGSSKDLILSIQFSDSFSREHFENWETPTKDPSEIAKKWGEVFFSKIFAKYNLKYTSPGILKSHKWKYTFPLRAMFQKDEIINFDNIEFQEFLRLSKKENLWLLGDWIFGQRVPKCILGSLYIGSILKQNPYQSVEDFLT